MNINNIKMVGRTRSKIISGLTTRYVWVRDEGMCIYCGNPASEIDHVIPTKDGGMSIRTNLVCTCHRCNTQKAYHLDDPIWFTRAIFWLLQKDEDVSWMDNFYK